MNHLNRRTRGPLRFDAPVAHAHDPAGRRGDLGRMRREEHGDARLPVQLGEQRQDPRFIEPCSSEFREVFRQQSFGLPMREALLEMLERARRLAAWAGVAPGNYESAGKPKGVGTRQDNVFLKSALFAAAAKLSGL